MGQGNFTEDFMLDAIKQITERGHSVADVSKGLGVSTHSLYSWRKRYALVLVPSLPIVTDAAELAFAAADGVVLYGPRTGSKTRRYSIPPNLPPGSLQHLLDSRVVGVSSLRPGLVEKVKGKVSGTVSRWMEVVETHGHVLACFSDGSPAFISKSHHHYLAGWPDEILLKNIMAFATKAAGLKNMTLPPNVRLRRRDNFVFAFNYGPKPWTLPKGVKPILGKTTVGPQDLAVWKVSESPVKR